MHVVVVGGGLAGARAVEELRKAGHTGEITLVGAEEHLPYERPPLSKDVLLGKSSPADAEVHDRAWYDERRVSLRLGSEAVALDLGRQMVTLDGGEELHYDALLLATGSEPRHLPDAEGLSVPMSYLRTVEDSEAIAALWEGGGHARRLLVIGAGWIGLEVAAAARQHEVEVTVVEPAELPLGRVLGPEMGRLFADLHREHGVDLRLSTTVESLADGPDEDGRPTVVASLSDGSTVTADALVVGIGVRPRVRLAEQAGLTIAEDGGVAVDETLRTSDPHVWAAGDIASEDHPVLGRRVRVEHWDVARQQGRHAARAILGDDAAYRTMPYFYTDQYDLGMEYVGSPGPDGYDRAVIDGDVAGRVLTVRYVKDGTVVAAMQINDWDAMDGLRQAVGRPLEEG
ncbi:NAD(P)/FAD-dependent oxidoreductase [Ornithinimicrobium tianjinense]|uniref:Pyridine nucleotide-disulfide oxidoreductase n=1 Tax=Ornithinimicrobium tianjinense TaxID=1195761 RepID=A0A917BPV3_9MICO|nr:FAD-dependent oxidoreductase [Ornithinimicrobium tianjinense]GGF52413.1 pyridine nucleotide-disulfide oxidoreductase [Ornithinimicrobium tianjinense]